MSIRIVFDPKIETMFGPGASFPAFFCDVCDQRIEDVGMGGYVWAAGEDRSPFGAALQMGHKGPCLEELAERLRASGSRDAWEELSKFPLYLANNMTANGMRYTLELIDDEA